MDSSQQRSAGEKFEKLVAIMARLRSPEGCPWDRDQDFDTIKPYTLEETYEVLDAIDARDWPHLAEELGDLTLQVVFYAQMAEEAGYFRVEDALDAINEKLIRRHPHIFGDARANTAEDVKKRWDEIKAEEKKAKKADTQDLLLDSVPRSLPALMEASQISSKAARAGFDWDTPEAVLAKLEEELHELSEARRGASQKEIEGEIGDLFFVLVNLARFMKVDPEQALRKSNAKFRTRFAHVQTELARAGKTLDRSTIDEMESLWQQAKSLE
jgi:MazG family protein